MLHFVATKGARLLITNFYDDFILASPPAMLRKELYGVGLPVYRMGLCDGWQEGDSLLTDVQCPWCFF